MVPGGQKLIDGRESADGPRNFWGAGGRVSTEITEVGEGMENGLGLGSFSVGWPCSVSSVGARFLLDDGWLGRVGRANTELTEVGEGTENGHSFCGSLCPRHAR